MERSAYTHGFRRIYAAAAGVLAAGIILALLAGQLREALVSPEFRQADPWQAPLQGRTAMSTDQTPTTVEELPRQVAPSAPAVVVSLAEEQTAPPRPLTGKLLYGFGWGVHPVFGDWRYHSGLDLEGEAGSIVNAIRGGQVTAIYRDRRYGLTVAVRTGPYTAYYGSLGEVFVKPGSMVNAGTRLGTIGSCPAEPYSHLHWALKQDDQDIDPDQ